ncbi:hypothetical protein [Parvibaculum sp.]|uniref:hypothetical protein n=1 Tax=Parvibaculum sp. TaxID=2024848 RepID=UPI001D72B256|nr:hypothetical protein [Parvibaculum sp.]MBX3490887.1 hypothetical protein [Parvibaculum sp.]
MEKTYSNRSNAKRAATAQGIADEVDIVQVGSRFCLAWRKATKALPANPSLVGTKPVMLATEDGDLGLIEAAKALQEASEVANETNAPVTVRDPVTDDVLETVAPDPKPADENEDIPSFLQRPKPTPEQEKEMAREIKAIEAKERAAKKAKDEQKKAAAAKAKAQSGSKATKTGTKRPRNAGPSDKVKEIIRLACRKNGVTPTELNEFTGWTGAPWKWLFANKKKTGYADRFGYSFVAEKVDGQTRYKLTPKA